MKYSQYSSRKKGNSAFYIILTICLLIVGVAAWFAFSNLADTTPKTDSDMQNSSTQQNSEYNGSSSSYNESKPNIDQGIENVIPSKPTADEVESVPYTEPAKKSYTMPVNGEILKDFSTATLQYSATYGDMRIHNAVDICCKENTVVTSCSDGVVQTVEKSSTLGNVITVDHGDGLIIKYAALNNITLKSGDSIKGGDKLGTVGTVPSECADQSHLHIEAFKNGKSISVLSLFEQ